MFVEILQRDQITEQLIVKNPGFKLNVQNISSDFKNLYQDYLFSGKKSMALYIIWSFHLYFNKDQSNRFSWHDVKTTEICKVYIKGLSFSLIYNFNIFYQWFPKTLTYFLVSTLFYFKLKFSLILALISLFLIP